MGQVSCMKRVSHSGVSNLCSIFSMQGFVTKGADKRAQANAGCGMGTPAWPGQHKTIPQLINGMATGKNNSVFPIGFPQSPDVCGSDLNWNTRWSDGY